MIKIMLLMCIFFLFAYDAMGFPHHRTNTSPSRAKRDFGFGLQLLDYFTNDDFHEMAAMPPPHKIGESSGDENYVVPGKRPRLVFSDDDDNESNGDDYPNAHSENLPLDQVDIETITKADNGEICYFAVDRTTHWENFNTGSRPPTSKVSKECNGDLINMGELLENEDGGVFGAVNELDTVLNRGQGLFDIDFEDELVRDGWKSRKICEKHRNELSLEWSNRRYYHYYFRRSHSESYKDKVCSIPEAIEKHSLRPILRYKLEINKDEAFAILKKDEILLHIGLPVCFRHKEYAQKTLANTVVTDFGYFIDPPVINDRFSQSPRIETDINYHPEEADSKSSSNSGISKCYEPYRPYRKAPLPIVSEEICKKFFDFAKSANENGLGPPRVGYNSLSVDRKQRKSRSVSRLIDMATKCIAPDNPEDLKSNTLTRLAPPKSKMESNEHYKQLLTNIADLYLKSNNKMEKIHVLSLITTVLPYHAVEEYIPGLTQYMFLKSRRLAKRLEQNEPHHHKERFDPIKVNHFISFITSSEIMIGLPYGWRNTKLQGQKFELPNTLRLMGNNQIIRLYKTRLREIDRLDLLMSDSSMIRMLNTCSAEKRKSLQGIDSYLAEGSEAFDDLFDIINELKEMKLIDIEYGDDLSRRLHEAKQYIRTDFRSHTKLESRVNDHCFIHSLSDPENENFRLDCSENVPNPHNHDHECIRCELVRDVLGEFRTLIVSLVKEMENTPLLEHVKEIQVTVHKAENKIIEMKKHILRTEFSNQQREDILNNLKPRSALITLDWGMKWIPMKFREKTIDWFGKRGISYHIAHVLAKVEDSSINLMQHTFVHVFENEVQDSDHVTAIIIHVLESLKKVGIEYATLRSDNAGCYHAASTIGSIPYISARTHVHIERFSFSEPQAGKSAADRMAAFMKRRVRDYVSQNNDASNGKELYKAMVSGTPLQGISVHYSSLQNPIPQVNKLKITGIRDYYDYIFYMNGDVRAWRYYKIGEGVLYEQPMFESKENRAWLHIIDEDGTTADAYTHDKAVNFWVYSSYLEGNIENELSLAEESVEFQDPEAGPSESDEAIFEDNNEECSAAFKSFGELLRHLNMGKHKKALQIMKVEDYALLTFVKRIEEIDRNRAIPIIISELQQANEIPINPNSNKGTYEMGWAIRAAKNSKRFSAEVLQFLDEKFDEGIKTGKKADPRDIEKMMKTEKIGDKKRFLPEDRLSARQIASYFSRRSSKLRQSSTQQSSKSNHELNIEREELLQEIQDNEGDPFLDYRYEPIFQDTFDEHLDQIMNEEDLFE